MEPFVVAYNTAYNTNNLKPFFANFPLDESNLLTCLSSPEHYLPPSLFVDRFRWSYRTFITPRPAILALSRVYDVPICPWKLRDLITIIYKVLGPILVITYS